LIAVPIPAGQQYVFETSRQRQHPVRMISHQRLIRRYNVPRSIRVARNPGLELDPLIEFEP
jgi:hypothetical protein